MSAKYKGFAQAAGAPGWLRHFAACSLIGLLGACASAPAPQPAPPPEEAAGPQTAPDADVTDLDSARAATDLSLRSDAPLIYTVKKGDTLWGIASHFLADPWEWPELWYENGQIHNPHLIYPGEQLKLVWVKGHPRVAGEVHLSPQIREMPLEGAIPTIPIEAIRNFLNGPRLVSADELVKAPYIVEFTEPHLANAAIAGIYVKGLTPRGPTTWAVIHPGDKYVDPDTGKTLGYEAIPVATAEVRKFGKPSELLMTQSYREALIGDRLLPVEKQSFEANFYPHRPKKDVRGSIISVFNGVTEIPQYQIVALNRGTDDGLDVGAVLTILQASRLVPDPYGTGTVTIPERSLGTMMVFKTTPHVAFALVLSVTGDAKVLDHFSSPEKPSLVD